MKINNTPLISIVIPLYNKEPYIHRAINSILNQTIQDFEIIVVDDGSTDDGGIIVNQIDDNRIKLITQENQGVSNARNRGIQESQTDLIAFLDADDEWKNDFIETILQLSSNFPQAGAYATSYQFVTANAKTRLPIVSGAPIPEAWQGILENYYQVSLNQLPFCASSIAVRKSVFDEISGFLEDAKLGEDLEMWLRISLNYPIAFTNTLLVLYHQDVDNRACTIQHYHGEVPLAESARSAIVQGKVPREEQQDLLEMVARQQLFSVQHRLKEGDKQNAKSILSSISYTKVFRRHWLWWRFWSVMPYSIFLTSRNLIEHFRKEA